MSSLPNIIAFAGKSESGKDTIGELLIKNNNYERHAFGDSVKETCRAIFKFTNEQLYGNKKDVIDKFWGIKPRDAFQFVGTDMCRNQMHKLIPSIGENIWVRSLEREILNAIESNKKIIVTDVRFQNELDLIKKLGGVVIRIHRHTGKNDQHESEKNVDSLKDVDIEFDNNEFFDKDSINKELYNKFISLF